MQKLLIVIGTILIVLGLCWPLVKKLGLGKLPGDVILSKGNTTFYFPIVTCIIISIMISILLWLLNR